MQTTDMAELVNSGRPMSPEEARAAADWLTGLARERWTELVTNGRFMRALRAGELPLDALRLFWANNYVFVAELNNLMGISFHRYNWWFKQRPEFLAAYADKIADELTHPRPPGHVQIVLEQGRIFGLTDEQMVHCQMLPACRAALEWRRAMAYEATMAERWAQHCNEQNIGHWSREMRAALTEHYGFTDEQLPYFRTHEEADLQEHDGIMAHGEFNRRVLEAILTEGAGPIRPGYRLEYVTLVSVDFNAMFYEGVYREAMSETHYGWR